MKLTVLINGDGPDMREAQARADELIGEDYDVEVLDWEADEAVSLSKLFDIYTTPAFIITGPDGSLIEFWQGQDMPMVSDMKHLM